MSTKQTASPKNASEEIDYPIFFLTFFVILGTIIGWRMSFYNLIDPNHGLGYYLGIAGGSMMLLLLLYPLQKRLESGAKFFSIRRWFQIHMCLGILGPFLVVFHSNFHFGDSNSSVAMATMLIVAFSGIFGRYFYSQVHHGLYGEKDTLGGLQARLKVENQSMTMLLEQFPEIAKELSDFAAKYTNPSFTVSGSFLRVLQAGQNVRKMQRLIKLHAIKAVNAHGATQGWSQGKIRREIHTIDARIQGEMASILRIIKFKFYERMFSLWHVFHIPLFFVMLTAAIVHIFTSHIY